MSFSPTQIKPNNSSSSSMVFLFSCCYYLLNLRGAFLFDLCAGSSFICLHSEVKVFPVFQPPWVLWSPGWLCPSPVDHAWSVFSLHISLSLNVQQRCSFVWSRTWADLLVRAVVAQKITKTQQTSRKIKVLWWESRLNNKKQKPPPTGLSSWIFWAQTR